MGKTEAGVFNCVLDSLTDIVPNATERKKVATTISKKIYYYLKENIKSLVILNPEVVKNILERNGSKSLRCDSKMLLLMDVDKVVMDIAKNCLNFKKD